MIVWLASYPKSGNTWLRAMIASYYFTEKGNFDFSLLKNIDQFPGFTYFKNYDDKFIKPQSTSKYWLDAQKKINLDNKLRFFKTHNALCTIENFPFTDQKNTLGAIYIVRDPRNVINSVLNHFDQSDHQEALKFMQDEKRCLIHKDKDRYTGFIPLFSWKTHQKSWVKNKLFPVLTIRYEDLQNYTFETFKKVFEFIKLISKSSKSFNREKAINVIQSCDFKVMKQMENENGFSESVMKKNEKKNVNFFHLGPKNDYRKLLNKDIILEMNKIYKEELQLYNYE